MMNVNWPSQCMRCMECGEMTDTMELQDYVCGKCRGEYALDE